MYIAIISFCNNDINIKQGEILESDFASAEEIADLLAAGYIELYTAPDEGISMEDVEEITGNLSNLSTTDKTTLVNAINEVVTNMGDLSIKEINNGVHNLDELDDGIYIPKGGSTVKLNIPRRSDGHDQGDVYSQYILEGILIKGTTPFSEEIQGGTHDIGYYIFTTADINNNYVSTLVQGYFEKIIYEDYPDQPIVMGEYETTYNTSKKYTNSIAGDLSQLNTTDKTTLVNAINEIDSSMAVVISDDFTTLDSESTAQEIYTAFGGKSELESIVTKLLDGAPLYVKTVVQSEETEDVETSYYSPCYYNCSMVDPSPTYDIQFAMIDGTYNNNTLTITLDGEGSTTITDASFNSSNDTYPTLSEVEAITGDLSQLNTTTKTDLVSAINEIVSSSGGGMPIYEVEGTTTSTPFVIQNKPVGIYIFKKNQYSPNTIHLKAYNDTNIEYFYTGTGFLVLTDTTLDKSLNSWKVVGRFYGSIYNDHLDNNNYYTTSMAEIKVWQSTGGFNNYDFIKNNNAGYKFMNPEARAKITQTHTYNVLPESTVVPTNDNQFTNKKYVDDAVAAAITTTLGGSY